jgi:hydrogenase maturation protease
MTRVLIVGYGNPLRGDDGAGQAVAQALADPADMPGIEIVQCHQLMPELAEPLATVDLAVFVDAIQAGPPGSIAITRLQQAAMAASGFDHHLEPDALLGLASRLYGRAPDGFLVSVGAFSLALGEGLSEPVAAALPEAIAAVRRLVAEHRAAG